MDLEMLLDTPIKETTSVDMDKSLSFGFLDTPSIISSKIPSPSKKNQILMTPKINRHVLERLEGIDNDGNWTPSVFLNTEDIERQSDSIGDDNNNNKNDNPSSAFVSDLLLSDEQATLNEIPKLQFNDIEQWPEFDELYSNQLNTSCHAFDDQDMQILCQQQTYDDDNNNNECCLQDKMDKLSLNCSPVRATSPNRNKFDNTNVNKKKVIPYTKHHDDSNTVKPILYLLDENRQFQAWLYRKEIQRLQQLMDFILIESKFF